MKILPPTTSPPSARIERRHSPKPARGRFGYRRYRPCLRWEFGFTCAFCLLHEADLVEHGAEGTGLTSVEHFVPVSSQGSVNDYANCFYACRFCNQSRSDAALIDRSSRRLLNPCAHVWAEHFAGAVDDRLVPTEGDGDAAYTHEVYDLDDPRKVGRRRVRRERLQEWRQLLLEGPGLLSALLARTAEAPAESRSTFLQAAEALRRSIAGALVDVQRYAAIPADAAEACGCGQAGPNDQPSLPRVFEVQVLDLPLPGSSPVKSGPR